MIFRALSFWKRQCSVLSRCKTFRLVRKFQISLFVQQDSMPLRIKNIHIVNQPYIFNVVFALFKPFLREKLRSRIIFHGTDRNSLHQYMNPKYLPECYGGTVEIPRVTGPQWYQLLVKCDIEYEGMSIDLKYCKFSLHLLTI